MTKRKRQPKTLKPLAQPKPRLPVLVRQNKVFELVVQGQTYEQICKRLDISEDTVARDMDAIAVEVAAIVQQRYGEILAVALVTYQETIDLCRAEYRRDVEREQAWEDGQLDYVQEQRVEKRLGVAPPDSSPARATDKDGEEEDEEETSAGLFDDFIKSLDTSDEPPAQPSTPPPAADPERQESLPLEIKTTRKRVRPVYRSNRTQWVMLMMTATQKMTDLCGLKTLKIEHTGAVNHEHTITLEQWKANATARRQEAEETLALQDEDEDV